MIRPIGSAALLICALASCVDKHQPLQPSVPPVATIVAPSPGSTVLLGDTVTVRVTATDTDGRVAYVHILVEQWPGTSETRFGGAGPHELKWIACCWVGPHIVGARAYDDDGNIGDARSVLTVKAPVGSVASLSRPTRATAYPNSEPRYSSPLGVASGGIVRPRKAATDRRRCGAQCVPRTLSRRLHVTARGL